MMLNKFLAIGILIPLLVLIAPIASASESNAKRYSDGYANGGQRASTDFQNHNPFNLTCDPTNAYTSGGGHTKIYCRGWTDGYTATWHNLGLDHPPTITPNPPSTNLITPNPHSTNPITPSSPTTDGWVTPLILFVIVVIIIAGIAYKIKHRGGRYRERQYFPDSMKENILDKQRHECAHCNRLLNVVDYDHKDNDRSNNKESNCIALCPNCHAIKTRRTK
jgi:hypothetical protein